MTLSTITPTTIVGATGTTDPYELFNNHNKIFHKGDKLVSADRVWERHGDDLIVPDFDAAATYKEGDIVFQDVVKKVAGLAPAPKEVTDYTGYDTTIQPDTWTHRYVKIDLEEFVSTNSGGTAYYFKNEAAGAVYRYYMGVAISGAVIKIMTGSYKKEHCASADVRNASSYYHVENNDTYVDNNVNYRILRMPFVDNVSCGVLGHPIVHYHRCVNGEPILVGDSGRHMVGKENWQHSESTPSTTGADVPAVRHAHGIWEAKRVYKYGNTLYIRTDATAPVEYTAAATVPTLSPVTELAQSWGWTDIAPTHKTAPFDLLAGTVAKFSTPAAWTVTPTGKFDTIAFSKLFAATVTIQIGAWQTIVHPKCKFTKDGKDYYFPAAEVVYLNEAYPPDTSVIITITPLNGEGSVGMIGFGDKVKIGATIAEFESSPKDFSLYEQQQWGNVLYVERVKLNRIEYSVEFNTDDYDFALKVLTSLTGKMVIIDGNDGETTRSFQSATMIGRFRSPRASTKVENGELSRISRATFSAEEIA